MMVHSVIYHGWVRHRRFQPTSHSLRLPLYMLYLDLDELESLARQLPLFSVESWNVLSFRRRDFLGASGDLSQAARETVQQHLGRRPAGAIRLLTLVRQWGYVFNPVSFYYCFEGDRLDAVVAEITNTPWGERHCYVLDAATSGNRTFHARFAKRFHVSPFMPMDQQYEWTFSHPGDSLAVHMKNLAAGGERPLFDATLLLRRREMTPAGLLRTLLRHPVMPMAVIGSIYLNAARLYMKRVPRYIHPARVTESVTD
jgi:DUF1365 family protein